MINNDLLTQKINILAGEQLKWFGRAGNMLTMGFGDEFSCVDLLGNLVTKSKFYVHIQCPWRLIYQNKILIGSDDMYTPALEMDELEDFIGLTSFDEKRDQFISMTASMTMVVTGAWVDKYAGLTIKFDNDFILEAFPSSSENEEVWRLGNLSVDENEDGRSLVVMSP